MGKRNAADVSFWAAHFTPWERSHAVVPVQDVPQAEP
jgi:hypothetical protein